MIQNFPYQKLFFDNFAGGGGASLGIQRAMGRSVDHAINHDKFALGMHRMNHEKTIHHCEDIFEIDPMEIAGGRRIGGAWFSPDCKHFSKAKGGKPLSKKIRGLALVMIKYAKARCEVMYMENVEEIQTWGPLLPSGKIDPKYKGRTWRSFLGVLGAGVSIDNPDLDEMVEVLDGYVTREELISGFGYNLETREIKACDLGAPTIRNRLYMVARCDGLPIVWPDQIRFSPKEIAKPENAGKRMLPWRTVAECIDWSIPCNSIFLTKKQAKRYRCRRPLARSTCRRIATGIDRFVLKAERPFLVNLTHQGGERVEGLDEPSMTITGANRGEKALVDTSVVPFIEEHANASNQRVMPADEPMRTLCAQVKGGHFGLTAAHMVHTAHGDVGKDGKKRGRGAIGVEEPSHTTLTTNDLALASCHLTKFNTGSVGAELTEPSPTVCSGSHSPETHGGAASTLGLVSASMIKLRGGAETHPLAGEITDPAHTVSAAGQHHALSAVYLAQHNGGFNTTPGHKADEPVSTISAKGSQQQIVSTNIVGFHKSHDDIGQAADIPMRTALTKEKLGIVAGSMAVYYGNDKDGQGVSEPMRTATVRDRLGLVESDCTPKMTAEQLVGAIRVAKFLRKHGVKFEGEFAMVMGMVIWDIGMRMLTARELFRAQGFGDDYIIDKAVLVDPRTGDTLMVDLTKEQQIRMCGNSVCPDVAEQLILANSPDMCLRFQQLQNA